MHLSGPEKWEKAATVAVVGASGKTGRHLVARLVTEDMRVIAVGRSPERLARYSDPRAERRVATFEEPSALRAALDGADVVINTAEARFVDSLLAALPPTCRRVIQLGTMRRYLAKPDEPGRYAARAEDVLRRYGIPALVIHPGLIYGHEDDQNVEKVLAFMRRWPHILPLVLPLPDGGRRTVQPIHIDDIVDALVAAAVRVEAPGAPIVAPGPPLSYADMLHLCADAAGRRLYILPVPTIVLSAMAHMAQWIGVKVPFGADSLDRAGEDKHQSSAMLAERLGVIPRSFAEGLRGRRGVPRARDCTD